MLSRSYVFLFYKLISCTFLQASPSSSSLATQPFFRNHLHLAIKPLPKKPSRTDVCIGVGVLCTLPDWMLKKKVVRPAAQIQFGHRSNSKARHHICTVKNQDCKCNNMACQTFPWVNHPVSLVSEESQIGVTHAIINLPSFWQRFHLLDVFQSEIHCLIIRWMWSI